MVVLAVALGVVLVAVVSILVSKRARSSATLARPTTSALDQFVRDSLELELASRVLGFANSTAQERANLRRTLGGEPNPEVVAKIEELVKSVELEFVRYGNEPDVEATVRVRYENGRLGVRSQRLPLTAVPATVLSELEAKTTTAVGHPWAFPWRAPG